MSKFRRADYTAALKGKTITRCEWTNDATENFRCLSIYFSDETMYSFRLYLSIEEEAELQDYKDGNISNERLLKPTPIPKANEDQ
jgi:hypothetical protein